jgi:hypothetical protein
MKEPQGKEWREALGEVAMVIRVGNGDVVEERPLPRHEVIS